MQFTKCCSLVKRHIFFAGPCSMNINEMCGIVLVVYWSLLLILCLQGMKIVPPNLSSNALRDSPKLWHLYIRRLLQRYFHRSYLIGTAKTTDMLFTNFLPQKFRHVEIKAKLFTDMKSWPGGKSVWKNEALDRGWEVFQSWSFSKRWRNWIVIVIPKCVKIYCQSKNFVKPLLCEVNVQRACGDGQIS